MSVDDELARHRANPRRKWEQTTEVGQDLERRFERTVEIFAERFELTVAELQAYLKRPREAWDESDGLRLKALAVGLRTGRLSVAYVRQQGGSP